MNDFDERIERYVAGDLTDDERIAFEDDVLSNPELADRLYADASIHIVLEDVARARRERTVEAATETPWWRSQMVRWFIPAAAVAAAVAVMVVQRAPMKPSVFRGRGNKVITIAPRGQVASPPATFSWRTFSAAASYRFELFDEFSQPVFNAVIVDTTITVGAGVTVPARGYWILTPLDDLNVSAGKSVLTRYNTAGGKR